MVKCKNCGHKVELVQEEWYHKNMRNGWGFSMFCPNSLHTKEAHTWKMQKAEEIMNEAEIKFPGYRIVYINMAITCNCEKPEPIEEEEAS